MNRLQIMEAFRDHKRKLDYLALLLEMIAKQGKTMFELGKSDTGGLKMIPKGISLSEIENAAPTVLSMLASYPREKIEKLMRIKEKGFYLDVDDEGKIVSPDKQEFPMEELTLLSYLMLFGLKGLVVKARKYDS